MPQFLVQNLSNKVVKLGIEPWADSETLMPEERVVFEYLEPADIAFSIMNDLQKPTVSVVSEWIRISAGGREKIFRLPPGEY
jgi:hypothetical protein